MRLYRGIFTILAGQALLTTAVPAALLIGHLNFGYSRSVAVSGDYADLYFLRAQSLGIAVVMGGVLILLLIAAHAIARHIAQPQLRLYQMSREIAEGNHNHEPEDRGPAEIVATTRNFGRIAERFDRLETARRTWLVSIADALREPTGDLGSKLDALDAVTPPIDAQFLADLRADHRQLARMTEDLHAIALSDLGRMPMTFATVDPRALIHNAVWENATMAKAQGVSLETAELPGYTIPVSWDGARIEQLFRTLIENSLRYTPRGGKIVLGLGQQRGAWELIIDDSAPGVDVALAQQLFEPFYRSSATSGQNAAGSGLGLATARAIVEAHHGRVEAGPSPIGGLRVIVTLPAAQPMA